MYCVDMIMFVSQRLNRYFVFVCLIIPFTFQLFAGHLTPNVYLLKNFMSLYTHVLSSFPVTCFFHLALDLPVGRSIFTLTFETFCGCSSY